MSRAPGPPRRAPRMLRHPVFAGAFAVLSLLVFCWPFVRAPPPHLAHAAIHLFAAWALVILVVSQVARHVGEPPADEAGEAGAVGEVGEVGGDQADDGARGSGGPGRGGGSAGRARGSEGRDA